MSVLALLDYAPIPKLHLGPLSVSPHGIATAVGFLAGARLMLPAAKARGIDEEHLWRLLTRALIGALVGARFAYVVNHLGDYTDRPLEALRVWEGGASLLGGIAFAVLAAIPEMRRQRLDFWTVMDAAAPGLALGIAIGRVGDLIVGDHLGKPTDFLLGYRCTGADSASPCNAPVGQAVHQPALYDLVSALALLGVLLWLRRRRLSTGSLFLTFVAWYGAGRVAEDFFRIDDTHGMFLTSSQWAATVAVLIAVVLLVTGRRPGTRRQEPAPLDARTVRS
jgi:phosphatidylglycerol---prolipoprotein diacylglyceryl transferase